MLPPARPAVLIHATRSFGADVEALHDELGDDADAILEQLFEAISRLREPEAIGTLPIVPYGHFGDSFMFNFHSHFSLTFKRTTDRDAEKRPLVFHFFLKKILRRVAEPG